MITDLKVNWVDRELNRKFLTDSGYCSRQYLHKHLTRSNEMLVAKFFKLPDVKGHCIRVNTSGSITYWYRKDDIQDLLSAITYKYDALK